MRVTRVLTIAALLSAGTALSACGTTSASSKSTTSKTGVLTALSRGGLHDAASGSPIAIGTIGSYSGSIAEANSGAKIIMEGWAKEVNATGGIDGHPVKLYVEDDGNNATTALTDAKQLVQQDHVVAIVGEDSGQDATFGPYLKSVGVPAVGGISYNPVDSSNSDFFPSGTTTLPLFFAAVAIGKTTTSNFGTMYCSEVPICAQSVPIYQHAAQLLNIPDKVNIAVSATATSYTAPCLAAKQGGVNELTLTAAAPEVVAIANACAQLGYKPQEVITAGGVSPQFFTVPALQGTLIADSQFPQFLSSSPATSGYQKFLKEYAPGILGTSNDNSISASAYVGAKLFQAAVAASGSSSVTSASVLRGLYSLHKDTLDGLAPPLTFAKGVPHNINCWFTMQIKNGTYAAPEGLHTSCLTSAQAHSLGVS